MVSLGLLALLVTVAKSTPLEQMTAAYEHGEISRAMRLAATIAEDPTSEPEALKSAALVRLLAAVRRGDHPTVIAELQQVAQAGADLGDYAAVLEVNAQMGVRDCAAADAKAETIAESSPFAAAAWSRVAACWLRARDLARADVAATKGHALARNDGQIAEIDVIRARLALATGDKKAAIVMLRHTAAEYANTSAGRSARAQLQSLGARAPAPTAEDLVERADHERILAKWAARRTYRVALGFANAAPVTRGRARLGQIELDVVDKYYWRAMTSLDALLKDARHPEIRAHALFIRGDIHARNGKLTAALDDFATACTEQPAEPYSREGALMGARIAYVSRDLARATWFTEWLIKAEKADRAPALITEDGAIGPGHTTSELVDAASWYAAWTERRKGAPREHIDALLAAIDVRGSMGPAALYWRLRYALDQKDDVGAKAFAATLLEVAPTSYYALAAADLTCGTDPACPMRLTIGEASRVPGTVAPPPQKPSRGFVGVVTLHMAGLTREAEKLARLVPQSSLEGPDKLVVAWLRARDGDVRHSAMAMRKLVTGPLTDLADPLVIALAYPRPHQDIVDKTAESYDLPPELIYAVIREESSFDVRAMSPRAARGLMQMMRPTAMRIAKDLKARGFQARQLFDPPVSIRFGTHYLSSLLELFDGDVAAVAASYHAGETAVGRWRNRLGELSLDEFVEEIPYASTRRYVQKVIASYGMYRLLYGHPGGTLLKVENKQL